MEKIHINLKKVFDSKLFTRFLYGVGGALVVSVIFSAGILVGFHKASFGRAWGEHYIDNFGTGDGSTMGINQHFPNAHGAIGKIIKIELPTIIVQDRDNTEKVVLISDDTDIENGRAEATSADLQLNNFVVVVGAPDDQGQIEAKFMRIIPSPNSLTTK